MPAPQRIHGPSQSFRASEPTTPVERVKRIAKTRGITFEEALQTPEGSQAYTEYRKGLFASQEAPPARSRGDSPSRFDEVRHFTSPATASRLQAFEERMHDDARERCLERHVVADAVGIARMTGELLAEDPQRYAEYARLQKAAAGN
jgi:hypothetical protein